jgi:hypothetical protein
VVVSSSSAVLLSLSAADFARAFKEVLDVRQVGGVERDGGQVRQQQALQGYGGGQ